MERKRKRNRKRKRIKQWETMQVTIPRPCFSCPDSLPALPYSESIITDCHTMFCVLTIFCLERTCESVPALFFPPVLTRISYRYLSLGLLSGSGVDPSWNWNYNKMTHHSSCKNVLYSGIRFNGKFKVSFSYIRLHNFIYWYNEVREFYIEVVAQFHFHFHIGWYGYSDCKFRFLVNCIYKLWL